jgi:hypothetical protein
LRGGITLVILIRCVHAALWAAAAYKWGDWKNWSKYYPTMLFMGMGDLIYNVVFFNKKLWTFHPGHINPIFSELMVIFTIFSCTVLIFLTHFPKTFFKQFQYITLWALIYIIIEIVLSNMGMQYNENGWTIWWSLLHNFYQFPLLAIHYKRPYLAWFLAITILIIIMRIFGIPLIIN